MKFSTLVKSDKDSSTVPSQRSGHRILKIGGNIWLVGGYNPDLPQPVMKTVRRFAIGEGAWTKTDKIDGEISDTLASHCAHEYGPFIIVHGGSKMPFGTTCRKSLFSFDTRNLRWNSLDSHMNDDDLPLGLYGHSMVIIEDILYIIGGTTGLTYHSRVYSIDLKKLDKWTLRFDDEDLHDRSYADIENIPNGRYRHECIVYGRFIFMLGGGTNIQCFELGKIHYYDTHTNTWHMTKANKDPIVNKIPLARRCLSVVQYETMAILQGGTDGVEIFDDIWALDLNPERAPLESYTPENTNFAWKRIGRMFEGSFFHDSAIDRTNGKIYTFGGSVNCSVVPYTNVMINSRSHSLSQFNLFPSTLYNIAEQTVLNVCSPQIKDYVKNKEFHKLNQSAKPA